MLTIIDNHATTYSFSHIHKSNNTKPIFIHVSHLFKISLASDFNLTFLITNVYIHSLWFLIINTDDGML